MLKIHIKKRYELLINKHESVFHETEINHSSDIDIKNFINLYKKCTAKSYSLNSYSYTSNNPLRFRCNLLERI